MRSWVWHNYSSAGNQAKARQGFNSLEYIRGEVLWGLLDKAPTSRRMQLINQFCQLFVQLHGLDWNQFDDGLLGGGPFFFFDRWLNEAHGVLRNFPEVDGTPFLEWVGARRALFAYARPSPTHQDFHPGNILVSTDGGAKVIDWTNFAITDTRFDLAWTLVLAHAYGWLGLRTQVLQGYECRSGKPVEQIEVFEVIACARRLLDLSVSLTQGAQRMGMNAQAVEAMRANMEAHRLIYRRFIERTGLHFETFDNLIGKSE